MISIQAPIIICFGLLIGSFINVLIYRIPRNISFILPRSRCESCGTLITWYQNIPLLSFIFLGGRSSCCKQKISFRHPFVEGLIAVAAYLLFPNYLTQHSLIHFFFFFSIFCAFTIHFFIDLDFQILPDGITLYLALLFVVYAGFSYASSHWVLGGVVGFSIPYFITWLFYKLRGKIGMGGGDIKLYGALGIYLGVQQILMAIFLSCFLGSLWGLILMACKRVKRETPIAFGPFIIIAATFQIFFPHMQMQLMRFIFD